MGKSQVNYCPVFYARGISPAFKLTDRLNWVSAWVTLRVGVSVGVRVC